MPSMPIFFIPHYYDPRIDPEPVLVDLCRIKVLFNLPSDHSLNAEATFSLYTLINSENPSCVRCLYPLELMKNWNPLKAFNRPSARIALRNRMLHSSHTAFIESPSRSNVIYWLKLGF